MMSGFMCDGNGLESDQLKINALFSPNPWHGQELWLDRIVGGNCGKGRTVFSFILLHID